MLPLRDANPTSITPYVTIGLIVINILVFFLIQGRGDANQEAEFKYEWAAIACEVTTGDPLDIEEITSGVCVDGAQAPIFPGKIVYLAVFTSMFLHGSIGHLLFNMWFLWIFGNNVEEAYGHIGYLLIFILGGLAGTAAYIAMHGDATVPLVGASGAIAVTMGAYAVLFPKHRVTSLVAFFIIPLPAAIFLFIWFFAQFGLGGSNVAWEAHAGGFIVGVAVSLLFRNRLLARVGGAGGRPPSI